MVEAIALLQSTKDMINVKIALGDEQALRRLITLCGQSETIQPCRLFASGENLEMQEMN